MKKLMISVILSGLCVAASAEDTITIALAGPLTGSFTQYGTMQNLGAEMAIKDINAKGGINGKKLVAKKYDDACEPKQAVSVTNKIVNDGVKFVIGHLCSSSTIPAAKIYNNEGIVMLTVSSTDPTLTSENDYHTIFRTIGTDLQSAPAAADYMIDVLKAKRIALLHDKQQYGQGFIAAIEKRFAEKGVKAAIVDSVTVGQQDFNALITRLKKADIDVVYWGGYYPELGLIIRQGADQGFTPQYVGADGVDNSDMFAIAGDAADGLEVVVAPNYAQDEKNAKLIERFKAENKDPTGVYVLPAYSATMILAEALQEAGEADPETVADIIHNKTFNTPIGEVAYEKNGDLKGFRTVVYKLRKDGTRELITK